MFRMIKKPLKKVFKVLFFIGATSFCFGQNTGIKSEFWNKVRYGGGIGLGFGNNTFNLAVSPSAIYQANDQLAMGLGLAFNYSKFRESKLAAYGGGLMTFYNPIRPIQLSAELEQLRVNRSFEVVGAPNLEDNYWSPALFLGVGYSNRNVTVGIRYDVLYDNEKSIYADPWMPFVRVYF